MAVAERSMPGPAPPRIGGPGLSAQKSWGGGGNDRLVGLYRRDGRGPEPPARSRPNAASSSSCQEKHPGRTQVAIARNVESAVDANAIRAATGANRALEPASGIARDRNCGFLEAAVRTFPRRRGGRGPWLYWALAVPYRTGGQVHSASRQPNNWIGPAALPRTQLLKVPTQTLRKRLNQSRYRPTPGLLTE